MRGGVRKRNRGRGTGRHTFSEERSEIRSTEGERERRKKEAVEEMRQMCKIQRATKRNQTPHTIACGIWSRKCWKTTKKSRRGQQGKSKSRRAVKMSASSPCSRKRHYSCSSGHISSREIDQFAKKDKSVFPPPARPFFFLISSSPVGGA